MARIIHEKPPIKKVTIEATDGTKTITQRKEKKARTPHLSTGFETDCITCGKPHIVEMSGPWACPKLFYKCPAIRWAHSFGSAEGQAFIRKRMKGDNRLIEEKLKELRAEMLNYAPPEKQRMFPKKQKTDDAPKDVLVMTMPTTPTVPKTEPKPKKRDPWLEDMLRKYS